MEYDDQSQRIMTTVRDTGSGIPYELRSRIFDEYVTYDGQVGGTGLGLSLSKRIVNKFGGSLELLTTTTGAAFQFTMQCTRCSTPPAVHGSDQARNDPDANHTNQSGTTHATVL